jgi:PAS domain S-box-containing protein
MKIYFRAVVFFINVLREFYFAMPGKLTPSEKNLLNKLHECEYFFDEIANNTSDIIYVLNLQINRITYSNRRTLTVLGPANMYLDQVHPQDQQLRRDHLSKCARLEKNKTNRIDLRLKIKDGSWNWFSISDKVFKAGADGTVLEIIGIVRDINAEKNFRQEMVEKELLLEKFVHASRDAICILKAVRNKGEAIVDYEFVRVNKFFEKFNDRSDLPGKKIFTEFPGIKPVFAASWQSVMETGNSFSEKFKVVWNGKKEGLHLGSAKYGDGIMVMWKKIA